MEPTGTVVLCNAYGLLIASLFFAPSLLRISYSENMVGRKSDVRHVYQSEGY
jgi:hypothetical protein